MGLASPNPNHLKIVKGMRLILALKSHKALLNIEFPILHGTVKLPGSFSFCVRPEKIPIFGKRVKS